MIIVIRLHHDIIFGYCLDYNDVTEEKILLNRLLKIYKECDTYDEFFNWFKLTYPKLLNFKKN